MKKILALALSLMLLLGCVSALAEDAGKQKITMLGAFSIAYDKGFKAFVDGQETEIRKMKQRRPGSCASPEAGKPYYVLVMNFNDEWYGVNTLADATEEDMIAVKDSFYEFMELDDGDITFEDSQTGEGTPLLIARAVDGSFAAVYTVYMSHEVEVDIYHAEDDVPVTEEEINTVITFLTDVQFTPAEK